jgi:hypothetical protein
MQILVCIFVKKENLKNNLCLDSKGKTINLIYPVRTLSIKIPQAL